jgi:hypothetical protein
MRAVEHKTPPCVCCNEEGKPGYVWLNTGLFWCEDCLPRLADFIENGGCEKVLPFKT